MKRKAWLAFTLLLLLLLGSFYFLRTERRVALQIMRLADIPILASAMVYHGGIWVESIPDQGATFYFTIPGAEESAIEPRTR